MDMAARLIILLLVAGFVAFPLGGAGAQPVQPIPSVTQPIPLDAPSVHIGNGLINAKIYLVDSGKGFYRGTRFDQAGVVGSLTLGRQDFYGPWFDRVSPQVMDYISTPEGIVGGPDSAISGPVEEFAPIGFDEAAPGDGFLKIGVGVLKKPDVKPYDHYRIYEILDPGQRSVQTTRSSVTFTQEIAGQFRYTKILRLIPGQPQMRIEHVLENIGGKPISTSVYDHNFLKLSQGNADIAVTLPFPITPDAAPDPNMVRIEGNRIVYVRPLIDKERASFLIAGFEGSEADYDIKVENTKTGAAMRVTADQPLTKMNLWSVRSVMAVEPYIGIKLAPGATKRWVYSYTYKAPARSVGAGNKASVFPVK
jgi:hypothetical protein